MKVARRRDPAPSRLAYRLHRLALTPLIRRLAVKMRHDSLEPPHRRDDRELLYVNFVLVSEPARVAAALAKNAMFRASEIRTDRTRLEWYAEGQTPASFGR